MHKNMYYKNLIIDIFAVTFRKEGVDWNLQDLRNKSCIIRHLPQGRCGLKSRTRLSSSVCDVVTFRKEGVDWNKLYIRKIISRVVTFRKEGVDWNMQDIAPRFHHAVTFRKEGVDWNKSGIMIVIPSQKSPSARKVWIEIIYVNNLVYLVCVTFRKEGVDWNIWRFDTCLPGA